MTISKTTFRAIDYLVEEEVALYKTARKKLRSCKSINEIKLIEIALDTLLERAVIRYRKQK